MGKHFLYHRFVLLVSMMMMMGINMQPAMMAPMLKPFVLGLGKEIGPLVRLAVMAWYIQVTLAFCASSR